ncbi:MAG: amidohydrolase family protein [Bacteroidota bacterium]
MGVNIGFGTDAGVFPHGENAREFELMVEAGMKPMDAIVSATKTNAFILEKSDQFGQLKAGLFADIVAVKGDPLKDISVLKKVSFVMKEGVVYKIEDE